MLPDAKVDFMPTDNEEVGLLQNSHDMENAADQMSSKGVRLNNRDAGNDDTIDQKNQDGDRHDCWYKTTMALRCMQPAVVPIVEDKISSLHKETVSKFGPKPCAKAISDDIRKSETENTAIFLHTCPLGTLVDCQVLLDIIKEHTTESIIFFEMIKCTDPQTWLDSPIDFVRLFIDKAWRCKINDFKDCDITVLCQIVKRCKPLMLMFNKEMLDSVKDVRNQTMHKAEMGITQEEMEDNLAAILDFLEYVKTFNDTEEVTKAIYCIQQLQANDPQFFFRHLCSTLIQEVLTDARMKYEHKRAATHELLQNIMYMESEQYRLQNTHETPCTEDTDEETVKQGQSEAPSSGNEHLPSVSSGMNSMAIEGFPQPIVKIQRELAKEINKMSPDELRAALLKTNAKDPRLLSEVLRPQSTS